jgi:hypothetical protein
MKFRFTSHLPLWLFVILSFLTLPLSVTAQRAKRRAAAQKKDSSAVVHFSAGQSALNVPFDLAGNLIFVQGRLNNSAPLWFIFDTGASSSVVDVKLAKTLGLKTRGHILGTGSAGTTMASRVRNVSVALPGVEVSGLTVYTLPVDFLSAPLGRRIGGVIGNDLIGACVVEIDYANKVINFYDRQGYHYNGTGEVIPFTVEGDGNIYGRAKVEIEGGAPLEGKFEIDTGSTGALELNTPFVKKHRLLSLVKRSKRVNVGGVGGTAGAVTTRARTVKLGKFALENVIVRLSQATKGDFASAQHDGTLGGAIFRRFKFTIDIQGRRLILEPNAQLAAPFEDDMSGIELVGDGPDFSTYLIDEVQENSPAAEAGVQGGDVLTAIDGRPASALTLEEVHQMFMQDGREYLLTLKRGDKTVQARIKLRRLI